MSAGRLSERRDLRPMAMCARDVAPSMVVLVQLGGESAPMPRTVQRVERVSPDNEADLSLRFHVPTGITFAVSPDHVLSIQGEEVRGYGELAAGDVIRVRNGWATVPSPEADRVITAPGRVIIRAYIDPAWERTQAEAEYHSTARPHGND